MPLLYQEGIHKILLEGGGNLNWSFINENLVDELRITIAPWIVGGENAISLVEGEGFSRMIESPRYNLTKIKKRESYITLQYRKCYE
jgi:2,5-diamino-6-(ribosylamino)-4(3H)-pyrimidinone 5'-phosphate reductase